jgi:hypothetical protein
MRGVILLCADVNVERSTATTQGSICYGAFKLVLLRKLCDALADCVEKLGDPKGDIHDKDLSRENTPLPVFIGRVS